MRRGKVVWILVCGSVAGLAAVTVCMRRDPYSFLRQLHPEEAWLKGKEWPYLVNPKLTHVFGFHQSPQAVEAVLIDHYRTGRRIEFGFNEYRACGLPIRFEWTSDGTWPSDVQCRVTVREPPSWIDDKIDALKQLLHLR
jgi:hypothetical protein